MWVYTDSMKPHKSRVGVNLARLLVGAFLVRIGVTWLALPPMIVQRIERRFIASKFGHFPTIFS